MGPPLQKRYPFPMYTLYDYLPSGNGYKVRLLLTQLGLPFRLVPVDILQGQSRTPDFLKKTPEGRIPVLELPDGRCLFESNAILCYLAAGTPFLPEDPYDRAQVLQWLFFEQNLHEPNIATVRFWVSILKAPERFGGELNHRMGKGHEALTTMETHLETNDWFAGDRYTIADIALYAYTHVAPEGGFQLSGYPAVMGWLERVRQQEGHVGIEYPFAG